MGWLFVLAFVLGVGAALIRWGRLPGGMAALAGTALMIAAAGYAWQGSATLAGSPAIPREGSAREPSLLAAVTPLMFGPSAVDAPLVARAEGLHLRGLDDVAANELGAALAGRPDDADLWTALGSALVEHAGGTLTPAARFAFGRALALRPDAPAPAFLVAAALAENGEVPAAAAAWRDMLARAPADARWRPVVAVLLARANATAG